MTTRVALFGLIGWSSLFLAVGLWPWRFECPNRVAIYFLPKPINGSLNFLCFLPFGLFIGWMGIGVSPVLAATVYCFLLSLVVEVGQLFLPGRYPSVADVALNTLGGTFGAILVSTAG